MTFGFTPTPTKSAPAPSKAPAPAPAPAQRIPIAAVAPKPATAVPAGHTVVSTQLNETGATLCKIWDDICLPDNPAVRELSKKMDEIVKAYCRGDTRLLPHWVECAKALSAASVQAGGKALPAEFIAAPVVVAKGVTEKGTTVPPPAVVVTTVDKKSDNPPKDREVAVLVDGSTAIPDGAMSVADPAQVPPPSTTGSGWGLPLLIGLPLAAWVLL